MVDISGIRTRIFGVEGEHSEHHHGLSTDCLKLF